MKAQQSKKMSNTDPTTNWRWTQVLATGKQILPLVSHPPCYSYSQCVLATTMCKQTQIACLYAEIVEDIKTRNSECTDIWYDKMLDTTMRRQPQKKHNKVWALQQTADGRGEGWGKDELNIVCVRKYLLRICTFQ